MDWIEGAKQGNADACTYMVKHFRGMAYTVAYERLKDPYLAEDAVQEAFTEAFLHLRKLNEPQAFPGWFRRIVIRQCNRVMRRKMHPTTGLDQAGHIAANEWSPAEWVEKQEMHRLIHSKVADLSANLRIVVQLYYFQGYSLHEISSYLEISASVVKKRLFDARRKLRGALPVADLVSVFHDLYGGGRRMLHIVNGDSVAEKLRQGVVQGEILVWREIYSEGPIFVDLTEPAHRSIRAQYLEKIMGVPYNEFIALCESQEKKLANFHEYEEIVLWFEHDLFDQAMLCYLLHWFSKQSLGRTKLSLLCIGEFPGIDLFRGLGQLSVKQLETLSGTWHSIGRKELELGARVWEAYSASDPSRLMELLQEDTSALPFVRDAFQLHLSRFPAVNNGLGVVEQTTLEVVAAGIEQPYELFNQVGGQLHFLGMGDLQYWNCLKQMSQGELPLLHIEGFVSFPSYSVHAEQFTQCRIHLTQQGRRVLAGEESWAEMNRVYEWLGGVPVQGAECSWRWDKTGNKLVRI